ncbi:unnamed protein product [Prorocentrum cordatum]|uniref:Uncharacterized protein n=1 Tax=Prorocentrum cordatum TaxID=2364126 RepID=A0ABN9PD62_9DINO|nr:unnamed protein product [Polarella glacialis]
MVHASTAKSIELADSRFSRSLCHQRQGLQPTGRRADTEVRPWVLHALLQRSGGRQREEPASRNTLLQCFQQFKHATEKDFVQMLEVTPMSPVHPGFKKLRCRHDAQGGVRILGHGYF